MKKKIVAWFLLFAMMIALVPAGSVQAATYKKGSKGPKVQYLQQNLSFLGFSTQGADGKFGNNTKQAVLEVQKKLGISQTGLVDDALYQRIKNTVADIQKYFKYIENVTGNTLSSRIIKKTRKKEVNRTPRNEKYYTYLKIEQKY